MMFRSRWMLALALLGTLACGGASDDVLHGEATRITDEGQGDPYSSPWRIVSGSTIDGWKIRDRRHGGVVLTAFGRAGREQQWLQREAEGWVTIGNGTDGFTPRAPLYRPATIREGMIWWIDAFGKDPDRVIDSFGTPINPDGDNPYFDPLELAARREMALTALGDRPLWRLDDFVETGHIEGIGPEPSELGVYLESAQPMPPDLPLVGLTRVMTLENTDHVALSAILVGGRVHVQWDHVGTLAQSLVGSSAGRWRSFRRTDGLA